MKKVLLVVDCQVEFADKNKLNYNKVVNFIKENKKQYDYLYATRFISGNKNFQKYLNWEYVEEKNSFDFSTDVVILKTGYGLDDYNVLNKDYHYDIVGCETDACILKIAMDLFDREYDFAILENYVYSNSELHMQALEIIKKNIGHLKK